MEGRDIGKIKREGYLRGTQAYNVRLAFVTVVLAGSFCLGAIIVMRTDKSLFGRTFLKTANEWDQQYNERVQRSMEIQAKRLKDLREDMSSSDL